MSSIIIYVIFQVTFNSIQFLLILSTKRNSECIPFQEYNHLDFYVYLSTTLSPCLPGVSSLRFHTKIFFFSVLTFICLSVSWVLMVADTTLTCHSQIFNVLNLIFNVKTHQTYYEAYCIQNRTFTIPFAF